MKYVWTVELLVFVTDLITCEVRHHSLRNMAACDSNRFLRKRKLPCDCHTPQSRYPLTPAERSKMYRERQKNDPVYIQKEKNRKKLAYQNRTQEKIDADKIKNRISQQRFRGRVKGGTLPVKKKILTRFEREKQRAYWKERQRLHREKMTAQKLRRKRERDIEYYNSIMDDEPSAVNKVAWKDEAQRKALSRMKACIPKNPERFAISIASLVRKATPRKREALRDRGLTYHSKSKKKIEFETETSSLVKRVLKKNPKMKKHFIKELTCLKKKRLIRSASTYFGIREAAVSSYSDASRKTRSDAIGEAASEAISEFFGRPGVSTNLPATKRIKKDQQERKVLDRTYKDLYQEFSEEIRSTKIPSLSISTFVRNKPTNVESTKKRSWYGCLCEVCTNAELKIRALVNLGQRHKSDVRLKDKYEAIRKTLCEKGSTKFHRLECIQRNCNSCGSDGLVQYFEPLIRVSQDESVVYTRWERMKKVYKGKDVTQIMPVFHKKSSSAVVCELSTEIETLSEHLFVAAWQQDQFSRLIRDVPTSWVILNMDFSENYSCIQQQEVQSAHWSHNQITIHPTVAYYKCPKKDCNQTVQEALIFVSNDLQHDAGAVMKFVSMANDHLMQKRGLAIERSIHLTDGCSAQYKSKTPFCDLSYSIEDFGFPTERHFYGSRHGKGPSDGAGAVIKSCARRAVMGQNLIINNAHDLYTFAKSKLEIDGNHCHSMRSVFLVDEESIDHDRPQRINTKTLVGTRKLHCIKTVSPLKVESRNLSCFCVGCTGEHAAACENSEYIQPWVEHDLKLTERGEASRNARGRGAQRRTNGCTIGALQSTRGAEHGTRGSQRGTKETQRSTRGTERGARGTQRGTRRTERGARGTQRGTRRTERGARGTERGARGTERSTRGTERGARGTQRGTRRTERGAREVHLVGLQETSDHSVVESIVANEVESVLGQHVECDMEPADVGCGQDDMEPADVGCGQEDMEPADVGCGQEDMEPEDVGCGQEDMEPADVGCGQEDIAIINSSDHSVVDETKPVVGQHVEFDVTPTVVRCDLAGMAPVAVTPHFTSDRDEMKMLDVSIIFENENEIVTSIDVTNDILAFINSSSLEDIALTELGCGLEDMAPADVGCGQKDMAPTDLGCGQADKAIKNSSDHSVVESIMACGQHVECDMEDMKPADVGCGQEDMQPDVGCRLEDMDPVVGCGQEDMEPSMGCGQEDMEPAMGCGQEDMEPAMGCRLEDMEPVVECGHENREPAMGCGQENMEPVAFTPQYNIGSYFLIAHGKRKIPAVIINTPSDMESLSEYGVWIQFHHNNHKFAGWLLEDKSFFCSYKDIIHSLNVPTIACKGSRILYSFEDVN